MNHAPRHHRCWPLLIGSLVAHATLMAQSLTVTGRVTLLAPATRGRPADNSNAVVYLTPLEATTGSPPRRKEPGSHRFQLVQKNKRFTPHLLVVPVGAIVEFPNEDPFFHNVFSLFEGQRFDLGLYEAGATRTITFNKPGVSYIFCNIHPEMSAVVVAVDTPYYSVSDRAGQVSIAGVADGHYQMQVFYERGMPEDLKTLARAVTLTDSARSLGTIEVAANPDFSLAHKNKYGQDYVPPPSGNPAYSRP